MARLTFDGSHLFGHYSPERRDKMTASNSTPADPDRPKGTASSPELTGGTGFTYEDIVAALYTASLLCEAPAPGLHAHHVVRVAVQQAGLGQPMDDLVVDGRAASGSTARLSVQVKRALVVSNAASNSDFRDIILRASHTVSGQGFDPRSDRVGVVTEEIAATSLRNFQTLCEWARSESDPAAFATKIHTVGLAGGLNEHFDVVRNILGAMASEPDLDVAVHALLSHFILIHAELMGEGSATVAQTVAMLADHLHPSDRGHAHALWLALLAIVRVGEGHAASFDRKVLVSKLHETYRFVGAPSMRVALASLAEEARLASQSIANSIGGTPIPRPRVAEKANEALLRHRFVQISGLPGTGKSAVLRNLIEDSLSTGPVLFLKADRLTGFSWPQYAQSIGAGGVPLEDLLVDICASGSPTLFIDGIDRVAVGQRAVIADIVNLVVSSKLLGKCRVVATVRDNGVEALRTWLSAFLDDGTAIVEVNGFDEEEAELLATALPSLRNLLFGAASVRAIVRRPFFASVLAKQNAGSQAAPTSEIELATLWWHHGGLGSDPNRAGHRRVALVELARAGAYTLGRDIPALQYDQSALADLDGDDIVRFTRGGQLVTFGHDIYFEWSFLQLLISVGDAWLELIRGIGEPPALGRVVELLSQTALLEGDNWHAHLERLEGSTGVRSQWLRAWLIGPFGLSSFEAHELTYNNSLITADGARLSTLAVWFQAEKTRANPLIVGGYTGESLDAQRRILFADMLAWPSDTELWRAFGTWLIRNLNNLPAHTRPDIVSVFEVWQHMFAGFPNSLSQAIIDTAVSWLEEISRPPNAAMPASSNWSDLNHHIVGELVTRLRSLLLLAGRTYPAVVTRYVKSLGSAARPSRDVVEPVLGYSPILSSVCPTVLVDFTLHALLRPLPEEVARRAAERHLPLGSHDFDWNSLSLDDHFGFFPSAPTREPFHSLFAIAPVEGHRLLRTLANHATTAWRQLHRVEFERRGNPIPVSIEFPWGRQLFWGSEREYMWSHGSVGPHVIQSGLLALEARAFAEVARGRPVDDVVRDVVDGHDSASVLGVAATIILTTKRLSATTLPIVANQRLWGWDIRRSVTSRHTAATLIGFTSADDPHYHAVIASNERHKGLPDLRWLASVFVIGGGELGATVSSMIATFATDLPFEYEEERDDPEAIAYYSRNAEIWAEVGVAENYHATAVPDGSGTIIELDNPKAKGPDIDRIAAHHTEMTKYLRLLTWVDRSFDTGKPTDEVPIAEAVAIARELDGPKLFLHSQDHTDLAFQRQGAVAGVAATLLRYPANVAAHDINWAIEACLRASNTPEATDPITSERSILLFHPVLYASRGLSRVVADGRIQRQAALPQLVRLTAHFYNEVRVNALAGMLATWDQDPQIVWMALELGVALAIVEWPGYESEPSSHAEQSAARVAHAVNTALARLDQSESALLPALPELPQPWVEANEDPSTLRFGGRRVATREWELSSTTLNVDLLAEIVTRLPISKILQDVERRELFLNWCESLLHWTLDRLSPDWAAASPDEFRGESSELYSWRRTCGAFVAQVALGLEVEDAITRLIRPVVQTGDDIFGSIAVRLVSLLSCNIIDSTTFPDATLSLLQAVIPRVLTHGAWRRSEWSREGLHDADLANMVKSLAFIEPSDASQAARFAHGDWMDVMRVQPAITPLLVRYSTNPNVTSAYLTVCERAQPFYPIDVFASQLSQLLGDVDGVPAGWRGTSLPARIGGLIQRFAESNQPLPSSIALSLLRALDKLIDMGDRRAAAIQTSESFKNVRLPTLAS
ncbi:MAG TPA: hypothetical protein VGM77_04370 [Gemmatimonadales bacterium]